MPQQLPRAVEIRRFAVGAEIVVPLHVGALLDVTLVIGFHATLRFRRSGRLGVAISLIVVVVIGRTFAHPAGRFAQHGRESLRARRQQVGRGNRLVGGDIAIMKTPVELGRAVGKALAFAVGDKGLFQVGGRVSAATLKATAVVRVIGALLEAEQLHAVFAGDHGGSIARLRLADIGPGGVGMMKVAGILARLGAQIDGAETRVAAGRKIRLRLVVTLRPHQPARQQPAQVVGQRARAVVVILVLARGGHGRRGSMRVDKSLQFVDGEHALGDIKRVVAVADAAILVGIRITVAAGATGRGIEMIHRLNVFTARQRQHALLPTQQQHVARLNRRLGIVRCRKGFGSFRIGGRGGGKIALVQGELGVDPAGQRARRLGRQRCGQVIAPTAIGQRSQTVGAGDMIETLLFDGLHQRRQYRIGLGRGARCRVAIRAVSYAGERIGHQQALRKRAVHERGSAVIVAQHVIGEGGQRLHGAVRTVSGLRRVKRDRVLEIGRGDAGAAVVIVDVETGPAALLFAVIQIQPRLLAEAGDGQALRIRSAGNGASARQLKRLGSSLALALERRRVADRGVGALRMDTAQRISRPYRAQRRLIRRQRQHFLEAGDGQVHFCLIGFVARGGRGGRRHGGLGGFRRRGTRLIGGGVIHCAGHIQAQVLGQILAIVICLAAVRRLPQRQHALPLRRRQTLRGSVVGGLGRVVGRHVRFVRLQLVGGGQQMRGLPGKAVLRRGLQCGIAMIQQLARKIRSARPDGARGDRGDGAHQPNSVTVPHAAVLPVWRSAPTL